MYKHLFTGTLDGVAQHGGRRGVSEEREREMEVGEQECAVRERGPGEENVCDLGKKGRNV